MSMTRYNLFSIRRAAGALVIALCVAAGASAKKPSLNVAGRESSGFNALEHVLQRPFGNDSFPAGQNFGNNMFISAGAGISAIGDDFMGRIRPGFRLGGQLGGWVTPVHGLRLTADLGVLSVHSGVGRTWFGSAHFDYLLNISALMRGYDPARRFELIGTVGPEYQRIRKNGVWGNELGIGASLQMRFNVAPSLYLYLEPRLAMLAGKRYDQPHDWRRMRADVSMNLGLGYRILHGAARMAGATRFVQTKDDNLFFGLGAGIWDMTRPNFPRHMLSTRNIAGKAYVGKMFSSASGLRLDMDFGEFDNGSANRHAAIASLDYVLNLNSAFGGYHPREVFQLLLNLGVSGAYVNVKGSSIYPGVNASLTAMFRLSNNWGIFIEPQVYAFTGGFAEKLGAHNSPLMSALVGLRYTVGDFSRLFPESYADYAPAKHWFITMGAGAARRMRGDYGTGLSGIVGFGKRFTPVSTWRITVDGNVFPRSPLYASAFVAADYMASLTTSTCGYDPDRVFDLHALIGVMGGAANYVGPLRASYGLRAGLHADFRLNRHLDLFVEPLFLASRGPVSRHAQGWTPDLRVMLGLNYKLGTPEGMRGRLSETVYGQRRNFASLTAAPTLYSGSRHRPSGALDASVGRWFSMVSALRLTYSNDWVGTSRRTLYVGTGHLDYMLNFTSLMDRSASRRFHIIGVLGAGVAFCGNAGSSAGLAATAGVQFRYNLPANFDIHLEPNALIWANRVTPDYGSPQRFTAQARLSLGASYRF